MLRIIPYLLACVIAALVPLKEQERVIKSAKFPGWPEEFEGRELIPISIDEKLQQMLSKNFDGKVGYFLSGTDEIVIRWVQEPNRSVHPATDCFLASGYKITQEKLCTDDKNQLWRCFSASRNQGTYRIRERIIDSEGTSWSDVSSWYWEATLQKTVGPWWIYTIRSRS